MTNLQIIPEIVVPGKRLGRHVKHDPRSFMFPFKASSVTLVSKRWSTPSTPILDQGDVGSCTGNATVAALLCAPFAGSLSTDQIASLNQTLALRIYSRATETDPFKGTYQPTDTGSDGLDVAKAAAQFGYISGFSHAFSLNDALAALVFTPIIIGIAWYESMDNVSSTGLINVSGQVRGGHEVCLDEIDAERKLVWFRNSWTSRWGIQGRACMSFDSFDRLLHEDGDATVFTPLTLPTPTPIPVPVPVPVSVDQTLADATRVWAAAPHVRDNKLAAAAVTKWRIAKGL